jgi:hypothetical protein
VSKTKKLLGILCLKVPAIVEEARRTARRAVKNEVQQEEGR